MTEADSGREIVTPGRTHRMEPRSDHHAYLTDHHSAVRFDQRAVRHPDLPAPLFVARAPGVGADRRYSVDRRGRHAPARQHRVSGRAPHGRTEPAGTGGRPATADDGDDHPGVHPAAHGARRQDRRSRRSRAAAQRQTSRGQSAPARWRSTRSTRRSSIGWCRTSSSSHSRTSNWRARSRSFGVGSPSGVSRNWGVSLSPEKPGRRDPARCQRAKDAFKLFETINNRGLKLSPTDIIKNFLLGNAARFGADELQARNNWAALIVHLDGTNPDAFFRYYLMALVGTRITASEVVAKFRTCSWPGCRGGCLARRHLYADPVEPDDEDGEEPPPAEGSSGIDPQPELQVSFVAFLARLVQCAKVYSELVLVKRPTRGSTAICATCG